MAAKKDKLGIEALRTDIQALTDAFWTLRDSMLTDAAVYQAEQQVQTTTIAQGDLPDIPESELTEAATLMGAIGHPQRLRITVLLAQAPVSVNDLVEKLELKTTGAAYHHLNVLMNNGIAEQPQRGTFALAAQATPRVHQILTALFGVASETPEEPKKSSKKKKS